MGSLASDRSVPHSVRTSPGGFRMVDASTISRFACALRKCILYAPAPLYLLRQNEHLTGIIEFDAADFERPVWLLVVSCSRRQDVNGCG